MSRTHKARLERKHRCYDCDLTFRSEHSLLAHMVLHDPSRPLQCSRCTLRYKNKDALVAHEKIHDLAQFSCDLCSMAFKRKDNLKRHIKSKHQGKAGIVVQPSEIRPVPTTEHHLVAGDNVVIALTATNQIQINSGSTLTLPKHDEAGEIVHHMILHQE